MNSRKPVSVSSYISSFPSSIGKTLSRIRACVRKAAPQAEERIGYQMPGFYQNGFLVYFAAFKDHIGFFPTASGMAAFRKELKGYDCSKGTVWFPYGKAIPYGLISRIVKFRVKENLNKKSKQS
jgi:uncharacterized protein YdhG (YjbR/CyaY superfamily)